MKIAVIGGGAAGFFAALSSKNHFPDAEVILLEKTQKTLAKVKVSGGGRCNVTHACFNISELAGFYPRGGKQLKKSFGIFNTTHTVEWFTKRGVELKTEADNRMFPASNESQTIIDCLVRESENLNIEIKLGFPVDELKKEERFIIYSNEEKHEFDYVIVATGGSPKRSGFDWLSSLNHDIIDPVPSLFTFNMPGENTAELMGIVAPNAAVRIQGTNLQQQGALLITHWGMSGPAVLKCSAWGARILHDMNYTFTSMVNWTGLANEELIREAFSDTKTKHGKKKMSNENPFNITSRMWEYLLKKVEINPDLIWAELSKKEQNRLINTLYNDAYKVEGKTTFKEEFVTCGGIALSDVNMSTMESRKCPGLFFAGEVLDIDGVTGGFNFQAAWTTGFIAGKLGKG
ncbi:MAG: NAD(P)/FAD-dependent oxidoreductase [Flavobacteriales bacterium]